MFTASKHKDWDEMENAIYALFSKLSVLSMELRKHVVLSSDTSRVSQYIFFSSRRRHTISVSAFLLNRSSYLFLISWFSLLLLQLLRHLFYRHLKLHRQRYILIRSEERRVGKECRFRWRPNHKKKIAVRL